MLDERLFYFIHGVVTMYFFVAGTTRIRRKEASRLERLCGYVLLYWCFLETKDLLFYLAPEIRQSYISNLLILIDMTAVTAGCGFVIELLNAGWFTPRRALGLVSPFLLSMKGARIYDLDAAPVAVRKWTELENIRAYYELFEEHRSEFQ